MARGDLHIHTNASDGLLSPFAVVKEAFKRNISTVGITDHETMQGMDSAKKAGLQYGVEIIPGIELSADLYGKEIHILGYFCNPRHPVFEKTLHEVKLSRLNRMEKMVEKLKKLGILIELSEILQKAKGEILGRPHLAAVLVQKGYCKTTAEAFQTIIGYGCPAYVKRYKIDAFNAIKLILEAGGIPVLAHPGIYKIDELIISLIDAGLMGIEVFHPDHSLIDVFRYESMAKRYKLLITGGSDFHGKGVGSSLFIGSITIESCYLEALKRTYNTITYI